MWVWVEDPEKVRARAGLISSLQQTIASVRPLQGNIGGLISACSAAVGGAPSGIDRRLIGDCQQAQGGVAAALQQLSAALEGARALDVRSQIWVDDPPPQGGGYW